MSTSNESSSRGQHPSVTISTNELKTTTATIEEKETTKNEENNKDTSINSTENKNEEEDIINIEDFKKHVKLTDNQFHSLLQHHLKDAPGRHSPNYSHVYEKCIHAMVQWRKRYRGNSRLWQRIFKKDKVLKELIESVPIIDVVMNYVDSYSTTSTHVNEKITIMDLCSGKGYLSMFLSEILPSDKVDKLILVDNAWACYQSETKSHHMSSEHIYGQIIHSSTPTATDDDEEGEQQQQEEDEEEEKIQSTKEEEGEMNYSLDNNSKGQEITRVTNSEYCQMINDNNNTNNNNNDNNKNNNDCNNNNHHQEHETYFTTWPIPLHASKQNLKAGRNKVQMKKHYFDKIQGPIIVLAIHLCGTLSLRAIDMFNNHDNVKFFALKPCCLPTMIHAKRKVVFKIGQHAFKAEEVCSHGEFNKGMWTGPRRSHLEAKFMKWANHLFEGVDVMKPSLHDNKNDDDSYDDDDDSYIGRKVKENIVIQECGGFQNTYIFAERKPLTSSLLWNNTNDIQST